MNILNEAYKDLNIVAERNAGKYQQAHPFPYIYFDDFFDETFLNSVLNEFPDLRTVNVSSYNSPTELKLASRGEGQFSPSAKQLAYFLNSEPFLKFLNTLTGIEETLLPDPYFQGGGYHEIKKGGFLKIHADFNKHQATQLDRRINILVYLNKDWAPEYGGDFELWDESMQRKEVGIAPLFNRMAIFSTTSLSYHGHPDALNCPDDRSRKSFALYYYTNGRPENETVAFKDMHGTIFKDRKGVEADKSMKRFTAFASVLKNVMPPFIFNGIRRIFIKD